MRGSKGGVEGRQKELDEKRKPLLILRKREKEQARWKKGCENGRKVLEGAGTRPDGCNKLRMRTWLGAVLCSKGIARRAGSSFACG